jgi:glycosyltransferase involved in cell wall biosynthesis
VNILVVTPWVPSPRRPRSFGLIEELATRHEVTVVAACWSDQDEHDLDRLAVQHTRVVRLSKRRGAARAAASLLSRRSLQQAYLDSPALRRAVREEAEQRRPDLAYFNVLRTAQFADEVSGPSVIDLDEFRSSYYEQLRNGSKSARWRLLGSIEGPRMRAAEDDAIASFDLLLVSSPSDLDRSPGSCRLVRSPHRMPTSSVGEEPAPRADEAKGAEPPRIVFVGRLSYRANVEAVRWFASEVLPLVVEEHPDVVFDVVGESPHRSLHPLVGPNLDLIGPVPEVAPYYQRSQVSVVPVFLATGVQMKLIESLSLGVATVTTSAVAGLAGIARSGPCVIADTADRWAEAVNELIRDEQHRAAVRLHGKRWADDHYDAGRIAASLHAAIGELQIDPTGSHADPRSERTRP